MRFSLIRTPSTRLQSRHGGEDRRVQRLDVVGDRHGGTLIKSDASPLLEDGDVQKSLQDVCQREIGEVARVLVRGDAGAETARQRRHEIPVGHHDPLGHARGSGGVAERADVVAGGGSAGNAVLATDLFDLSHAVESDVLGLRRGDRCYPRLRHLSVALGDLLHLDDRLQRHRLLHHRKHLHRLGGAAHDRLHLRLAENVQDRIRTQCVICGNQGESVGIASLLRNTPLQTISRKNTETSKLRQKDNLSPLHIARERDQA